MSFDKALKFTLQWEGGFVNDPDDPGGATMRGVTQKVYDGYRARKKLPKKPVKEITMEEVGDIYKNQYWNRAKCDVLPEKLAITVFDVAVNHGVGRANEFMKAARLSMDEDPTNDEMELTRRVIDMRVNFYYGLVKRKPVMKKFLNGWLNRSRALKKEVGY